MLNRENLFRKYNRNFDQDDLIIEENTIYEIDMECYECMMKEKKIRDKGSDELD